MDTLDCIVETMIALSIVDGEIDVNELKLIKKILSNALTKKYDDVDNHLLSVAKSVAERTKNSKGVLELVKNNATSLSNLKNEDKKSIIEAMELLIKSDATIDNNERVTYSCFKENIKLDKGLFEFLKRTYESTFKLQCDSCKSARISETKVEELERWVGKKQVTEKLASGKTKSRIISVTYVLKRYHYRCNECGYEFHKDQKEER